MDIDKKKIGLQIRNTRLHSNEANDSFGRTLKTANKARINRQLFMEGLAWCNDGKDLNEATDKVIIDDKETIKKDAINFIRGYQEGLYQLGFRYGYQGHYYKDINMDEIRSLGYTGVIYFPDRFINGCIDGYDKMLFDDRKAGIGRK